MYETSAGTSRRSLDVFVSLAAHTKVTSPLPSSKDQPLSRDGRAAGVPNCMRPTGRPETLTKELDRAKSRQ